MDDFFHLFPNLEELFALYEEVEGKITNFKRWYNIDCPSNCGSCCEVSARKIDVSVFELIPVSLKIWGEKKAHDYLSLLDSLTNDAPCVLFRPGKIPGTGRCGFYPLRPLYCRLFGFCAVVDKSGRIRPSLCRIMKMTIPWKDLNHEDILLPVAPHLSRRLLLLYPPYSQERLPINRALTKALKLVGLRLHLLSESKHTPTILLDKFTSFCYGDNNQAVGL